jgi:hypothetical protein
MTAEKSEGGQRLVEEAKHEREKGMQVERRVCIE